MACPHRRPGSGCLRTPRHPKAGGRDSARLRNTHPRHSTRCGAPLRKPSCSGLCRSAPRGAPPSVQKAGAVKRKSETTLGLPLARGAVRRAQRDPGGTAHLASPPVPEYGYARTPEIPTPKNARRTSSTGVSHRERKGGREGERMQARGNLPWPEGPVYPENRRPLCEKPESGWPQ